MKLFVVIPAFNEEKTILKILNQIEEVDLNYLGFKKEIVIIDDFSTDQTRTILKKLENKYKIIYQNRNQGKGTALRKGFEYIFNQRVEKNDYIIIQDADLEYDPKDYQRLLECALENNADVVYGSRRLNSKNKQYSGLSFYLGGIVLSWITNLLYGLRITDEPTCYKLFRVSILKTIPLKCQRFEFCPEVTAKIAKRKIKIYETPISYYPRNKKQGKKLNWKDGLKAIWILLKYRFNK